MSYENFWPVLGTSDEKVAYLMRLFGQARTRRTTFESQWEEAASLLLPEYRNSFTFGHNRPPGAKYTQFQVDSTGAIALHRFMSICDAMLTPYNMMWSVVRADDPALMRSPAVRRYYDDVTRILWEHRYRSSANFIGQQQQNYICLGAFGNQAMFVDEYDGQPERKYARGIRYIGMGPGEIYYLQNHQGRVDAYIRHFRWTARQAHQRWPDKLPPALVAALEQNSQILYDFLQFVLPRHDYLPDNMFDAKGKPWSSTYVSVVGWSILEEGGYRTFPLAVGRYTQAPEEEYGRGPAQQVLPDLKTLNAEKGLFLTQGHRAARPPLLIADDGMIDFKLQPDSYNFGGMTSDGKPLIGILPTGNLQITEEMMRESAKQVNDAFLVSLFPLLLDLQKSGGQRSAREVIEMMNDRGIFLSLGRQYGEYLGALNDRELDLLSYLGQLPKMPPALREARGQYSMVYTSPLARAMSGQEIAGFMRTVELGQSVVNVTGDNSLMDIFDFDTALQDVGHLQFVPQDWFVSPRQLQAKRKQRADEAARDREVKEMPGRAAMAKAQAIQTKAATGGNIGGTLSGTPEGGMPQVPQQVPRGMPGRPGFSGRAAR